MAKNVTLDNDLFVILAGANLLESWLEVCGVPHENVFVLPALSRILQRGKGGLCRSHCSNVIELAKAQVGKYKTLPVVDNDKLAYFENIPDVDIGEQQIFAHVISEDFIFAGTNDKKSIRAVCNHLPASAILGQKIVCLEQCICSLIQSYGWSKVNAAITRLIVKERSEGKRIDNRLLCLFSETTPSEMHTKDALESFLTPLAKECAAVLYPEWMQLS